MHGSASLFPPFNSWVGEYDSESRANRLAGFATRALIDEANLTPKPGLVDCRGGGVHADMTLETMRISALSLFSMSKLIAQIAEGKDLSRRLREQVGAAGRDGERSMLVETGGCNTYRAQFGQLVCSSPAQPCDATLPTRALSPDPPLDLLNFMIPMLAPCRPMVRLPQNSLVLQGPGRGKEWISPYRGNWFTGASCRACERSSGRPSAIGCFNGNYVEPCGHMPST